MKLLAPKKNNFEAPHFLGTEQCLNSLWLSTKPNMKQERTVTCSYVCLCVCLEPPQIQLLRARQRRWTGHRVWANVVSQSALLFVTGRMAIVICTSIGMEVKKTYYYSIVGSGLFALARFANDMRMWQHTVRQTLRMIKLESAAVELERKSLQIYTQL
jgi:hypothetical protein